jgi:hypothetical protein
VEEATYLRGYVHERTEEIASLRMQTAQPDFEQDVSRSVFALLTRSGGRMVVAVRFHINLSKYVLTSIP